MAISAQVHKDTEAKRCDRNTHTHVEEIETYKSKERHRDGERHNGTKTRKERTEKRDRDEGETGSL